MAITVNDPCYASEASDALTTKGMLGCEGKRIMTEFCDVALPVPLDAAFTYRVPAGMLPVVGARVLVPFREQRLLGVVTDVHDRAPKVKAKNLISVLDTDPVLDKTLMQLGRWLADYYLAPVGEVFRTMLPLMAEFKKSIYDRITDLG